MCNSIMENSTSITKVNTDATVAGETPLHSELHKCFIDAGGKADSWVHLLHSAIVNFVCVGSAFLSILVFCCLCGLVE